MDVNQDIKREVSEVWLPETNDHSFDTLHGNEIKKEVIETGTFVALVEEATCYKSLQLDIKSEIPVPQYENNVFVKSELPSSELQEANEKDESHTGEKPFQCEVCDCKFLRRINFQKHMKIHLIEKPIKHSLCDYKSIRANKLRLLMKTHRGENPFKCSVCDYISTTKIDFQQHLRLHTGEKPFKYDYSNALSGKTNSIINENLKRARRSITLEDKMSVIRRMEAGESRASVGKALNMPPSTISSIMRNASKTKQSMQRATKLSATLVTYRRSNLFEKMEQLLLLWVEDLNKKNVPLTQAIITQKAKSIFEYLKKKEGNQCNETFLASRGWFVRFKARTKFKSVKIKKINHNEKRPRQSITLEDKMVVIQMMEAGETRPNVCRAMNMPPSTISTIMKNADKIKESMQNATRISATQASYRRSKLFEKMEQLLTLWVDDLNQKNIPLTRAEIAKKAKLIFEELKKKEGGDQCNETFLASRGWFVRFKARTKCVKSTKVGTETAVVQPSDCRSILEEDSEHGFKTQRNVTEGLKEVPVDDLTLLLETNTETLSNENLEELAEKLNQQKEEKKEETTRLKIIKTSDLQRILTSLESLTNELCDMDHDYERREAVRKGIVSALNPYFKILKERTKKTKKKSNFSFKKRQHSQPGPKDL